MKRLIHSKLKDVDPAIHLVLFEYKQRKHFSRPNKVPVDATRKFEAFGQRKNWPGLN